MSVPSEPDGRQDPTEAASAPGGPLSRVLDTELKRRVATALVGAVVVLGVVFAAPAAAVILVAGCAAVAAAWEWSRLVGLAALPARLGYLGVVAAVAAAGVWGLDGQWTGPLAVVAAIWLAALGWLLLGGGPNPGGPRRLFWMFFGALALPGLVWAVAALAGPSPGSRWLLVYALCLVWVADIGAYFAGRAWGRAKLAPRVSAGKTRAGLWGGLVLVAAYALLAGGAGLRLPGGALAVWTGLAVAAGVLSVVGDLVESTLKREAGVKDSGRLLPGHGGLLDRIDSLVAAMPLLALGITWLLGGGSA